MNLYMLTSNAQIIHPLNQYVLYECIFYSLYDIDFAVGIDVLKTTIIAFLNEW